MVDMTQKPLWPHQQRARDLVAAALKAGYRRPLVILPTGGGKTVLCSTMAQAHVEGGGSVLWVAHREELVEMAATELRGFGLHVGVVRAVVQPDESAPVQVASIQTLISRVYWPTASLVVCDECHHLAPGNTWGEFIAHYKESIILGVTATPARGDGQALTIFNRLIIPTSVRELTDAGFLVPCEIIRPSKALKPGTIAQRPVDLWKKHAHGLKTMVFANNAVAAEQFLADFLAAGVRAAFVHCELDERSDVIHAYHNGHLDVLINLAILTEGFNSTDTECIILARTVGNASLMLQIVGRGLRSHPGKTRCLLLDATGQTHIHGPPDEERLYSLTGKGMRRKGAKTEERFCQICGALYQPGDTECTGCGTSSPPLTAPTVTKDPMVKYEFIRKRTPEQKKQHWLSLKAKGEAAGHKPGRAYWIYKSAYGEDPVND